MQKVYIVALFALLVSLGYASNLYAQSMRCETSRIVARGNTTAEVVQLCGEPSARDIHEECIDPISRQRIVGQPGVCNVVVYDARKQQARLPYDRLTSEIWTYNFGPNRLLYKLTFRNGELSEITTKGYGSR